MLRRRIWGHTVRPHEVIQPSTPGVTVLPEPAVVSGRGGLDVALSVSVFETLEEGGLIVSSCHWTHGFEEGESVENEGRRRRR